MRYFLGRLGLALGIVGGAISLFLHIATFVTMIPLPWILVPFAIMFVAVACGQAVKSGRCYQKPTRNWNLLGFAVFGYAVLTFVYFYRTTGGASSVSIVGGQYVAMYKDQVIRTITENEYRMFPNLWSRVMSAWIGMMALFYLIQSPSMSDSGGADA